MAVAINSICKKGKISDKNFNDAQYVTWNTSIKPLLEAYLGGKVENEKEMEKQLKNFEQAFIPLFNEEELKKKLEKCGFGDRELVTEYADACKNFVSSFNEKNAYLLTSDFLPGNGEAEDFSKSLSDNLSKKLKKQLGDSFKEDDFNGAIADVEKALVSLYSVGA